MKKFFVITLFLLPMLSLGMSHGGTPEAEAQPIPAADQAAAANAGTESATLTALDFPLAGAPEAEAKPVPGVDQAAAADAGTESDTLTALDFPLAGAPEAEAEPAPGVDQATVEGAGSDGAATGALQGAVCERTITADVVALDQPFFYNRYGAYNPGGLIFALRRDVVDKETGLSEAEGGKLRRSRVMLRADKRPRPLTLRMNVGDCLQINFQNLLDPMRTEDQPATREVSIHVNGLQLVNSISDDGSYVGRNESSLAKSGGRATYTLYAEHENTYLLSSLGATTGAEGGGGTTAFGLFGAVNVEPRGAEWYRSQVTRDEMELATVGRTPDDQPIINYDAVYPAGHRFAGLPILKMLDGNEIVHSDLTAIITVPDGTYPDNPTYPNRNEPFREFTSIFGDEIFARQAFDLYEGRHFEATLHSVRDGFAINYGTGGIGSEIIANRLGVGPVWNCTACKYEEFFLTSWAVADPAMIVDKPANSGGIPIPAGPKATKALYPDDPSNVYHAYLNDHLKIRNLHAGPQEEHIFHLHAHQWLQTPDDPDSTYLDSQFLSPGAAFTYEIAFGGSGNRNETAGDSIFHCHFYPHFAQGMWALWRVHDVFEEGTELDADGRPVPGARALPDGEIPAGTPIPAVVPLPGLAMAPMPGAVHVEPRDADGNGKFDSSQVVITEPDADNDGLPDRNPGYPFYVPGEAGHRPPTPPMDLVDDGGLSRHLILDGDFMQIQTPLDFTKEVHSAEARFLDEAGTPAEKAAMAFHAEPFHTSFTPEGTSAPFITNGLPPVPGAPYADPCRDDLGNPVSHANPRVYKAALIQMDVVMNKVGWHVPQQRFLTLWDDVQPTLDKVRPPQPLVMRLNTNDCANFYHTNLVPGYYELDDFQVRTPTDVIGQHIHLLKFDVMSADGSANGFNYEDGTFSPDEVRERIVAIRDFNQCLGDEIGGGDPRDGTEACPVAQVHPFFGPGPDNKWVGARTTIQRWFVDPLVNSQGWDRGLGSIFTHDHFSPSTHQQVGLYATVLVEPEGSTWRDPETGVTFGTRHDGGPTNWSADILTTDPVHSHREFYFEFTDFQQAYEAGYGLNENGDPIPDFKGALNPPHKVKWRDTSLPEIFFFPDFCAGGLPRPCPEAIAADDPGTYSVNYRSEPVGLRIRDPQTGAQAQGQAGDLSFVFSSKVQRADPALNVQPELYSNSLTGGVQNRDPYTPLARVYQGDKVRIRIQAGGDEEMHTASIHGLKWRQEFASENSGWRNSQTMGISEQFILDTPILPVPDSAGDTADYLYTMGAQVDDYWNGVWGLLRAYKQLQTGADNLLPLPNNPIEPTVANVNNASQFTELCPVDAPVRSFDVTAVAAQDVLPGGSLVYNSRRGFRPQKPAGPLHDPTALLYVLTEDLVLDPVTGEPVGLKAGVPVEPLILRANAGDCLKVTLRNRVPDPAPDLDGFNSLPPTIHKDKNARTGQWTPGITTFNANDIRPSSQVGLHPQLVAFDVTKSDGANVGLNPDQTVAPGNGGALKQYTWYAGDISMDRPEDTGEIELVATPVEFGAINLMPSDKIKHSNKGLVGALVIEPKDATWKVDPGTRASATVQKADGTSFREFVVVLQNDINLRLGAWGSPDDKGPLPDQGEDGDQAVPADSQDAAQKAINYRTEPLWFRLEVDPLDPLADAHQKNIFSNSLIDGQDPQTPVFTAEAGESARFRVLHPGGHPRSHVFAIHGHTWQQTPYINGSTEIGHNPLSQWIGSQGGISASSHFDIVLDSAGGKFMVPGDYLYRDQAAFGSAGGMWGIFRVTPPTPDAITNVYYPPVANDDAANTDKETAVTITVLANDFDIDGSLDPATVTITGSGPASGAAAVNPDGTVTYSPNAGFTDADSFTYTVNDDDGATSNEATVIIIERIEEVDVNDPPLASNDAATTGQDSAVTIDVLANDSDSDGDLDPATVTITGSGPASGAVSSNGDGTVTYSPTGGYAGSDGFTYTVDDDDGATSNEATVTITVNAIEAANEPPLANDDAATTGEDTAIAIAVLANDADSDGALDPATVTITGSGPASGTVSNNGDGTVTYTPTGGYAGSDSFTYTVADDDGATSNEATVTITVNAVNEPPIAGDDTAATDEDTAVTIAGADLLANDSDPDGDALSIAAVDAASANGGTITDSGDDTYTYMPEAGFTGDDTFTYSVDDGNGGTAMATVTVTVAPAPISVSGGVCAKNRQPSGCPYEQTIVDQPFDRGALIIAGKIIRDSGDDQLNEDILILVDGHEIFASYDQPGKDEVETFGPLMVDLEAGEHTIVIRHGDDSEDPQSAGSIEVDITISFVPGG